MRASYENYEYLACSFRANESIWVFPEAAALGYDDPGLLPEENARRVYMEQYDQ
jgi:hypothetical protein